MISNKTEEKILAKINKLFVKQSGFEKGESSLCVACKFSSFQKNFVRPNFPFSKDMMQPKNDNPDEVVQLAAAESAISLLVHDFSDALKDIKKTP